MFKALSIALSLASSVLGLSAATDYTSKYDGVKVLRVPTVDQAEALDNLIDSLSLQRWQGTRTHVDVEVTTDKYDEFVDAVNSLYRSSRTSQKVQVTTMHEDLGASIKEESAGLFETFFAGASAAST